MIFKKLRQLERKENGVQNKMWELSMVVEMEL